MPAIEVAVPVDIRSSEPLVVVRALPPEELPVPYSLETKGREPLFGLNKTTGELHVRDTARQRTAGEKLLCI
jgi:hypothetical protein